MVDSACLRIIGTRQSSISQGHDLLAYHLSKSSWKVSGWQGSLRQRLIARFFRSRYQRLSPAQIYHIVLTNWFSRTNLVHLVWGDHLVEFVDRPDRCILTLHQPFEAWTEARWENIGKCAGVICMAERECVEIRRRYPHLLCVYIPHGVDTGFWRDLPGPPKRQICAVGRHLRNFKMLLRVAHALLDRHPDLNFFWVVNPDYKLPPALVSQLPPERFKILRNLTAEELHQLYAESWLFCTPYDNVAASNAIVESMASGTPIFTTRVGGMSSYGDAGIITMVENNDDAALLDAVTSCLASPELRAKLGARGREHAEKYFNWPVVIAAHEAFYGQVLRARPRTGPGSDQPAADKPAAQFDGNRN